MFILSTVPCGRLCYTYAGIQLPHRTHGSPLGHQKSEWLQSGRHLARNSPWTGSLGKHWEQ